MCAPARRISSSECVCESECAGGGGGPNPLSVAQTGVIVIGCGASCLLAWLLAPTRLNRVKSQIKLGLQTASRRLRITCIHALPRHQIPSISPRLRLSVHGRRRHSLDATEGTKPNQTKPNPPPVSSRSRSRSRSRGGKTEREMHSSNNSYIKLLFGATCCALYI